MQKLASAPFTPSEDLKLLFTKCHNPTASWSEIAELLQNQFRINKHSNLLKHRYEHYLNIPSLKTQCEQKNFPFIEKRKSPEDFLELYRQIKQYHDKSTTVKKEEAYEKQIIKKELYPNFEESMILFQHEATQILNIPNIEEEFDLLRHKVTEDLTQEEANRLQKIEKVHFRTKQLRLQNQKKVSKLHRIIRNIITAQSRCFAEDILINEMNIGKLLIKVLKNVYHNASKVAKMVIQDQQKQKKMESDRQKAERRKHFIYNPTDSRSNHVSSLQNQPFKPSNFHSVSKDQPTISSQYFLDDLTSIERFYSEQPEPLYRKDIIKLFYFPQEKSSQETNQPIYDTQDGEKLSLKRLVIILKMFKKLELLHIKHSQTAENQIRAEIQEIKSHQPSVYQDSRQVKSVKKTGKIPHKIQTNWGQQQYYDDANPYKRKGHFPQPLDYPTKKRNGNPMIIDIPNPDSHQRSFKQKSKIHPKVLVRHAQKEDLQIINQEEFHSQIFAKNSNYNYSQVQSHNETDIYDQFQGQFTSPQVNMEDKPSETQHNVLRDKDTIKFYEAEQQPQKQFLFETPFEKLQREQQELKRQMNAAKKSTKKQGKQRANKSTPKRQSSPIDTLTELMDSNRDKQAQIQLSAATELYPKKQKHDYKGYLMNMLNSQITDNKKVIKRKGKAGKKYQIDD